MRLSLSDPLTSSSSPLDSPPLISGPKVVTRPFESNASASSFSNSSIGMKSSFCFTPLPPLDSLPLISGPKNCSSPFLSLSSVCWFSCSSIDINLGFCFTPSPPLVSPPPPLISGPKVVKRPFESNAFVSSSSLIGMKSSFCSTPSTTEKKAVPRPFASYVVIIVIVIAIVIVIRPRATERETGLK